MEVGICLFVYLFITQEQNFRVYLESQKSIQLSEF